MKGKSGMFANNGPSNRVRRMPSSPKSSEVEISMAGLTDAIRQEGCRVAQLGFMMEDEIFAASVDFARSVLLAGLTGEGVPLPHAEAFCSTYDDAVQAERRRLTNGVSACQ